MLTIEPPFYQHAGVTVFRDHQDPDQLYYLPPAPRLAVTGNALAFTLYKYRHDLTDNPERDPTRAVGAGFALLETEAGLDARDLARLSAYAVDQTGRSGARLSPVVMRSASAKALVAHGEGDALIESLVDHQPVPVTAPHHAAFSLALTAEGAALVEQALAGGAVPVGVAYQMRFLALTPALHARVHVDYRRAYDRLAGSIGFHYYVGLELDAEIKDLVESGAIRIEITSFSDDEDEARQMKLVTALIRDRLQSDLMKPSLPPQPAEGGSPVGALLSALGLGGGEATASSAVFVLKAKAEVEHELKDLDLVFDGRTAIELSHDVAAFLSAMRGDDAPAPTVRELDLDDPFFSELRVDVRPVMSFDDMADLIEVDVDVALGDRRWACAFTRAAHEPQRFEVPLTRPGADEYEVRVDYHFDAERGAGPTTLSSGPFTTRGRVLAIDPLSDLRYRRLRILAGPVDFKLVPRLDVALRVPADTDSAPDLASAEITLDAAHPEAAWSLRQARSAAPPRIVARTDWEDGAGRRHAGDEITVDGDSYVALGPYRDVLALAVQPVVDWKLVSQLQVEIRYTDGDYVVDRTLGFTATAAATARVEIALLDPRQRRYRYRQTRFRLDGTIAEDDWQDADRSVLVVGPERKTTADVRIDVLAIPPDVLAVRVDLFATDATGAEQDSPMLFRPGDGEKIASVALDAGGRLHYRYEVRRIRAGGDELVRTGESDGPLLVVQG